MLCDLYLIKTIEKEDHSRHIITKLPKNQMPLMQVEKKSNIIWWGMISFTNVNLPWKTTEAEGSKQYVWGLEV
jgi:hypothetical protein